jgi:hypothetical protein
MHWNTEDKKANTGDLTPPKTQGSTQGESVQKEKSPKGWQNDAIKEFWKMQVLPWRGILESQSALFPVMRVLGCSISTDLVQASSPLRMSRKLKTLEVTGVLLLKSHPSTTLLELLITS